MNDDLISRSRLLRDPYFREDRYPVSHHLRMAIMEQPAVDPEEAFKNLAYVKESLEMAKQTMAPVRPGRWVYKPYNGDDELWLYHCSECGTPNANKRNYCSNCGAKMDGAADDADTLLDRR